MVDRAYGDDISAEDEALLRAHEQNDVVPPAEDDDANPVTPAQVAAEQGLSTDGKPAGEGAPAPTSTPAPAPGGEPPAGEGGTEEERLRAFLEQHKGKSPEELARLAFQQTARANQAGFTARQAQARLEEITSGAKSALERIQARREALRTQNEEFEQRLRDDPDAATKDLHTRLLTEDERRLADEERQTRRSTAINIAATAIPNFNADATFEFGRELNYTPEELAGVTDHRDIISLHLASLSGRLIKAGVMDVHGNLLQPPEAVASTHPALGGKEPVQTLSSSGGRTVNAGKTLEQQLQDISTMSDAELDKIDPKVLEDLLRQAG